MIAFDITIEMHFNFHVYMYVRWKLLSDHFAGSYCPVWDMQHMYV